MTREFHGPTLAPLLVWRVDAHELGVATFSATQRPVLSMGSCATIWRRSYCGPKTQAGTSPASWSVSSGLSCNVAYWPRSRTPHAAFDGPTPNKMFFGVVDGVGEGLAGKRREAREERIQMNRSRSCGACTGTDLANDSKHVAVEAACVPTVLTRSSGARNRRHNSAVHSG